MVVFAEQLVFFREAMDCLLELIVFLDDHVVLIACSASLSHARWIGWRHPQDQSGHHGRQRDQER